MIPLSLLDAAMAMGAASEAGAGRVIVRRVTTDSRDIQAGDLFFALPGARFDGHDFVHEAAFKRAAAAVVQRDRFSGVAMALANWDLGGLPLLAVDDTIAALGRLAAHYRMYVMKPSTAVVAVTGSNGKTTTKQMIDHVLGPTLAGRISPRSFNNHIGVPLTLLSADEGDQYVVVEVGTNTPGEIAALSKIASPNVGVITSVGEAHLQGLGSIDGVAAEKASMLDHVRAGGLALVNIDRPEIRRFLRHPGGVRLSTFGLDSSAARRVSILSADFSGTTLEVDGRSRIRLGMPGAHHATNAAAAFIVGQWFGIAPADIAERLADFRTADGRTRVIEIDGVTVIDDTYNANPASMLAALDVLARDASRRRVFVMGDMMELGEQSPALHRRVVAQALDAGVELVVAVGESASDAARSFDGGANGRHVMSCPDVAAAGHALVAVLREGDRVWVKGSRAMGLERIVETLQANRRPHLAVA